MSRLIEPSAPISSSVVSGTRTPEQAIRMPVVLAYRFRCSGYRRREQNLCVVTSTIDAADSFWGGVDSK